MAELSVIEISLGDENYTCRGNKRCLNSGDRVDQFLLLMAMVISVSLANCQIVLAQEKTVVVTGTAYQFGEKGKYDIPSADKSSSTNDGTESGGQFSILGDMKQY